MLFTTLLLPVLSLVHTATSELVPALQPRLASTDLDTRQSGSSLLGKRQSCASAYPYTCSAVNGDAMCMATGEVCCQRIAIDGSGTYPYVCPVSHPYCCPSDSAGNPLCGSDRSCKASSSDTQNHGTGSQTTEKTSEGIGMTVESSVLVVAVLGGLAMM